jgi:signal transduction histidine kinase
LVTELFPGGIGGLILGGVSVGLGVAALVSFGRARRLRDRLADERSLLLAEAVDGWRDGFAKWDADGRLVVCNETYRRLMPVAAENLEPGADFATLARDLLATGAIHVEGSAEDWLAKRGGGPVDFRLADGRVMEVTQRRTRDGGVICMLADVSERRESEIKLLHAKRQAELANRAKIEFLANMSHELRTPLNAVIGFSEMALMQLHGPLEPPYRIHLENIRNAGVHLLEIIGDILDVSQIEIDAIELEEETIDLHAIVHSALRMVRRRAERNRTRLLDRVATNLPLVYGDPRRVRQILVNLLSNAVKFTPEGGVVTVEAELVADGDLNLSVLDTGIGMAPEDIPRAMAPFGQLEGALERRHEGTGLGLYLTRRLIGLHGGSLVLESRKGEGTRATVRFPRDRLRAGGATGKEGHS